MRSELQTCSSSTQTPGHTLTPVFPHMPGAFLSCLVSSPLPQSSSNVSSSPTFHDSFWQCPFSAVWLYTCPLLMLLACSWNHLFGGLVPSGGHFCVMLSLFHLPLRLDIKHIAYICKYLLTKLSFNLVILKGSGSYEFPPF